MVDGYDSMEPGENPEGHTNSDSQTNDRSFCENDLERAKDSDFQPTPTTTISTIALQSGDTRLVIALLQVRNSLKIFILLIVIHILSYNLL